MASVTSTSSSKRAIIRFLSINDVYELENLPRFATAVHETRAAAQKEEEESGGNVVIKVLAVVAGDFLAPSLLSCLDDGRGMTDVLNACDIDYVCLGNHETDIPHRAMLERVAESNFVWINSSMPALPVLDVPLDAATKLPEHALIEVGGVKIAMLGLLTDDQSLYRPNSFGSAPILPLLPTAERLREQLYKEGEVGCVLAMTHQSIAMDRALAEKRLFPLILGGHDHDPYIETYVEGGREGGKEGESSIRIPSSVSLEEEGGREGGREGLSEKSTLVKVGMDCKSIGFVDVVFALDEEEEDEGGREGGLSKSKKNRRSPEIKVTTREAVSFDSDAAVSERVVVHLRVLEELERANLCLVPTHTPLSSKGIRKMQTSMGTMLLTAARKALQVDCCFVNGGNIRAGVAYPITQRHFTYKDLKAEVPYPCNMMVLRVPGAVLSSLIQFSRRFSLLDPPVEKGGFLQVDDGVRTDPNTHAITHIMHQPLDPSKLYSMATTWGVVSGIDDLRPILDYIKEHPDATFPSSAESGRGLKEVLVTHYSRALWWDLAKQVGFHAIDTNGDGVLCRKEVEAATREYYGEALSQLVLANLMATADYDGDGVVSVSEFIRICMSHEEAFRDGDVDGDGHMSFDDVWFMLKVHFDGKTGGSRSPIRGAGRGQGLTEGDVRRIFDEIDVDGVHGISWAEFREHLAQQREPASIAI